MSVPTRRPAAGNQQYQPTQRNHEDQLTRVIVALASQYGRYGYRRVTVLLQLIRLARRQRSRAAHSGAETFNALLGTWQGTAPLPAGVCSIKFELRKKADDPARFAGFPVLLCMPILPGIVTHGTDIQNPLLAQLSPLSAVLSGTAANGAIQFSVDRVIGKSGSGCALTSFAVTPFGADQMSAEWQEGACQKEQGGQILLRRVGK